MAQVLKEDKKQESSKMETNEIRAVIKYIFKKGMSPKEIYEGRISTEDEHRPGRPVESVTQENIDKIHDLVMLDRRMTIRQIEETLGIPKPTVDRIMREPLGLRELSARWVPKLLTPDQKAVRRKLSSDNLVLFEADSEEFVTRFVTMDETWAHHFTPESKQQSMQWRHSGSPPPKKAKTVPSAGKIMQLREAIKENRRGKLSMMIVYHQDNAPSHRSLQAMAAIYDSGFELLPHAPYSPELAPSDSHLFPHLKKSLSGIHFRSDEERLAPGFYRRVKAKTFLQDDDVPIDDTTTKPLFTPQENDAKDIFSNLIIPFDMPRKRSAIGVRTPAARRMAARAARGQSSRTLENPQQSQARFQSDRLRHRVQRASETPQQSQTRQEADRLRHFRQRASTWADMLNAAFHYNPALNYEQFTFLQIGHMDKQCLHCTAFKYNGERPGMCYSAGKVGSTGDIALSTASSGIAATLLHGDRTAHSTFKLPLDLNRDEVPVCNLNADSAMGEVLRQCKFIVWDECTMAHRHALEAVDITLKDCRQDQRPMGDVVLLLAGDFRHILPNYP
ncbi:hypothetical protein LAZ67_13000475 [Cordylochernes scorpioides]|uniref:ATP-dependent DNA helicase n=1 Tax=Cordylochernes scorpioides TaxID=51811 RepID=A0ABY6L6H6_9ARAC|nr:hypothetical protein LAZ67_13000475 [Cordylochernes scorpioides]